MTKHEMNYDDYTAAEEQNNSLMDGILDKIGTRGKFQTRFNLIFNMLFLVIAAMPPLNFMIAMTLQDHWCHVPGRSETNLTVDEWKEQTIPRDAGNLSFSKCKMYNLTSGEEMSCQFGYEYDTRWYSSTVPSQEDWVCEDQIKVANAFAVHQVGQVVGGFLFCQLGDTYGRKPQFFISMVLAGIARSLLTVSSSIYPLFLFIAILGGSPIGAVFESPLALSAKKSLERHNCTRQLTKLKSFLAPEERNKDPRHVVWSDLDTRGTSNGAAWESNADQARSMTRDGYFGMEVSDNERRAHIAMMQLLGWSLGMCVVPLIAWVFRDWVPFIIVTSLPSLLVVFVYRLFPESPRWLATKGLPVKCMEVLRYIAKVNGTTVPHGTMETLEKIALTKERKFGVRGLFSSMVIMKNTILLCLCRISGYVTFYTLVLNVSNMSGNPYLNFLYQSAVEVPGFVIGRYLSDWIGRRWTQTLVQWLMALANIVIIVAISLSYVDWIPAVLVVFIRCCTTAINYTAYLQSMEVYPTCIRQTGTAFGSLAAGALTAMAPYIVHLGASEDSRYPYVVLAIMTFIGGLFSSFLPETLHEKLPETLKDAQVFGKHQKFWSLPGKKRKIQRNTEK